MKNIFRLPPPTGLRRVGFFAAGGFLLLAAVGGFLACNEPTPERKISIDTPAADTLVSSVNFCYIIKVDSFVTVDFIDFFTGTEAVKAFKHDNPSVSGDDNSSFYIRNNENSLSAFLLSDSSRIIMQTFSNDEEGNFRFNEKISTAQFKNLFKDTKFKHYKNIPFKITIVNSVIKTIEEQYIP